MPIPPEGSPAAEIPPDLERRARRRGQWAAWLAALWWFTGVAFWAEAHSSGNMNLIVIHGVVGMVLGAAAAMSGHPLVPPPQADPDPPGAPRRGMRPPGQFPRRGGHRGR